jgi:hypothetical protein
MSAVQRRRARGASRRRQRSPYTGGLFRPHRRIRNGVDPAERAYASTPQIRGDQATRRGRSARATSAGPASITDATSRSAAPKRASRASWHRNCQAPCALARSTSPKSFNSSSRFDAVPVEMEACTASRDCGSGPRRINSSTRARAPGLPRAINRAVRSGI